MTKKIAVIQSSYIPWKGYFDIINMVDEFIIYDDAQYTRRDWRNRNRIKCQAGVRWLSIPVETKGRYLDKIKEIKISDKNWAVRHWKALMHNYAKAPHFKDYRAIFEQLYLGSEEEYLSEINYRFINKINKLLGITTKISWSWDYKFEGDNSEKLISLCKAAGADEYISGPSAKNYIDEALFRKTNIKLTWMDYSGYPEHHQLYPPFEHRVSIIDLIFNEGPNSTKYMKSFVELKADTKPEEMRVPI